MSTCHLSAIRRVVADVVPTGWRVGLFGSVSRCPGSSPCAVLSSDVDLLVIHPVAAECEVLEVRRQLAVAAAAAGWLADVTVMSGAEVVSTGFWFGERVVDLADVGISCLRAAASRHHSGLAE